MSRMKDYLARVCEDAGLDPTTEQGMIYAQEMLDAEDARSGAPADEAEILETLASLRYL